MSNSAENHDQPEGATKMTGDPVGGEPKSPVRGTSAEPPQDDFQPAHAAGVFTLVTGFLLWADLMTKSAAFKFLEVSIFTAPSGFPAVTRSPIHEIFPGFGLEAALNLGAFNGWFAWAPWLLIGVSVLAVPVCFYIAVYRSDRWLSVIALALIASGAAGNLYDRAIIGGVRDFIRWSIQWGDKEYVWPNFNIADSAIVCGVALIIWMEWRRPVDDSDSPDTEEKPAAS